MTVNVWGVNSFKKKLEKRKTKQAVKGIPHIN